MTKIKIFCAVALLFIAEVCFAQKTISPISGGSSSSGSATNVSTGKTLWVDSVNGSDSTGTRGNLTKPFATLGKAKTNAVAGDTVMVLSGNYTNNDLGKAGVNWFFLDGAKVFFVDPTSGPGYGFFDDRSSGATTNVVEGLGEFYFDSQFNANVFGAIVVTNRLTDFTFHAKKVGFRDQLGANAVSGCISIKNCKLVNVYVDELYDIDYGLGDSYCSGVYWESGEAHVVANRIKMDDGYIVWAKEISGGTTNSLWVTANQMLQFTAVGGTGAIQIDALTDPFRVWLDTKELSVISGTAYRQSGGGRVYIRAEKIVSATQAPVQLLGGNFWLDSQKITGKGWLDVSGGFLYANVNHFEDLGGGTAAGISLSGGTNFIRGGIATITNLPVIKWMGGSQTIQGMTAYTFGGTLTNAPIWSFGSNGNLTLKNCALLGGNTNSIYATNAQTVQASGILTATNAIHALVTLTGMKQAVGAFLSSGAIQANGGFDGDGSRLTFSTLGTTGMVTTGTGFQNTNTAVPGGLSMNTTNGNPIVISATPQPLSYTGSGAAGTNVSVNCTNGHVFTLLMTNNVFLTAANMAVGQQISITLIQGGIGDFKLSFNTNTIRTNSVDGYTVVTNVGGQTYVSLVPGYYGTNAGVGVRKLF